MEFIGKTHSQMEITIGSETGHKIVALSICGVKRVRPDGNVIVPLNNHI